MLERAVSFVRNGAMMRNTDERAMPEDDGRINGVNLGGWLVLERWMTPGLFRASGEEDEIWLHRSTDPAELERLLRRHRDTYITEDDFRAISAHGLNLVRIPVPFFIRDASNTSTVRSTGRRGPGLRCSSTCTPCPGRRTGSTMAA